MTGAETPQTSQLIISETANEECAYNPPKDFQNLSLEKHKRFGAPQNKMCFGNCNKAHSVLDQDEKSTWRKYIIHCRNNYNKFLEGTKQNNSNGNENKEKEKNVSKEEKTEKSDEKGEKKDGKK